MAIGLLCNSCRKSNSNLNAKKCKCGKVYPRQRKYRVRTKTPVGWRTKTVVSLSEAQNLETEFKKIRESSDTTQEETVSPENQPLSPSPTLTPTSLILEARSNTFPALVPTSLANRVTGFMALPAIGPNISPARASGMSLWSIRDDYIRVEKGVEMKFHSEAHDTDPENWEEPNYPLLSDYVEDTILHEVWGGNKKHSSYLNMVRLACWKDVPINEIDRAFVKTLRQQIRTKGLAVEHKKLTKAQKNRLEATGRLMSASTENNYITALSKVLRHAVEEDDYDLNPPPLKKLPENNRRERTFSDEEEDRLIGYFESDPKLEHYADLLKVLLDTGLRLGNPSQVRTVS